MQIILVSRHLKTARTLHIMPWHLAVAGGFFLAMVFSTSMMLSWLSIQLRLPYVDSALAALVAEERQRSESSVGATLSVMAARLGELQGRLLQLDTVSERMSGMLGLRGGEGKAVRPAGEGGPYLPDTLTLALMEKEIDRLMREIDARATDLAAMDFWVLEKRVQDRMLPTMLPVRSGSLGSGFGRRSDPFSGQAARHEGLDFSAPTGTPVLAAAEGVVEMAGWHPEYGQVVDVDHGAGLLTRYAHLSKIAVQAGQRIKRGERLGAVGSTGRSTGAHLHFEVRQFGVAMNPVRFLGRGNDAARLAAGY